MLSSSYCFIFLFFLLLVSSIPYFLLLFLSFNVTLSFLVSPFFLFPLVLPVYSFSYIILFLSLYFSFSLVDLLSYFSLLITYFIFSLFLSYFSLSYALVLLSIYFAFDYPFFSVPLYLYHIPTTPFFLLLSFINPVFLVSLIYLSSLLLSLSL